tara:strand:+ start:5286 stop:5447 length:162 start_codon:yes stop_codon:yes gene_type:complete
MIQIIKWINHLVAAALVVAKKMFFFVMSVFIRKGFVFIVQSANEELIWVLRMQ